MANQHGLLHSSGPWSDFDSGAFFTTMCTVQGKVVIDRDALVMPTPREHGAG
jgi:hypothetical protein